jgi:hypothetical protein
LNRTEELLAKLRASGAEMACFVGSLPETAADLTLDGKGWSVRQIVEHVVLAEHGMQRLFRAGKPAATPRASREEQFAAGMANRRSKAISPEVVVPQGKYASLGEALSAFTMVRQETIRTLELEQRDLAALECKHPMAGTVNGHEMLTILIGHSDRHLAQIREIISKQGRA